MRGMVWTPEFLAKFEERASQWRKSGNVRTHVIHDEPDGGRRAKQIERSTGLPLKLAEVQVLRACMNALEVHPKIAFAWRQNVGAFDAGFKKDRTRRVVRFAFKGCADILGCLKGGRWLAVECKATGKKATKEQQAFLDRINKSGGFGICVDDPQTLVNALEAI